MAAPKGRPVPKGKGAFAQNPATGQWEPVGRRLTRGTIGEQTAGFWLGQRGFMILDGPSGAGGHLGNAPGFDGVAWNPRAQELVIYDNKSFRAVGNVSDAGAITRNLERNLGDQIAHLERGRRGLPPAALEEVNKALRKMRAAQKALRTGGALPHGVSLGISNAGGFSRGVSQALAARGIRFIDMNKAQDVLRPRMVSRLRSKATAGLLRRSTEKAELRALQKLADEARAEAASKLGRQAGKRAAGALERAAPRVAGKMLLRASARKAAGRVASLMPLVGLGFAAKDAWAGAEDIVRSHTARGLAGVGLAITDVAAEFLHLGDAVSGVGGTALSLGVQGGVIAGQIRIEMDRLAEKMRELQKEIERLGALPDERRLREHYEMDDEAIAELRKAMTDPDATPPEPSAADLPPPPDWGEDDAVWQDSPPDRPAARPHAPTPSAPAPSAPPGRWVDQPIA